MRAGITANTDIFYVVEVLNIYHNYCSPSLYVAIEIFQLFALDSVRYYRKAFSLNMIKKLILIETVFFITPTLNYLQSLIQFMFYGDIFAFLRN